MVRIAIPFDVKSENIKNKRAIIRTELAKAGGQLSGAPIDDPGLRGFYSCTTLVSSVPRARELARKLVQSETDIMAIYANDFLSSTLDNPLCVNIRVWGKEKDPFLYMNALGCRAFYPVSQYSYRAILADSNVTILEKMRNVNTFYSTTSTPSRKNDVFIALETNEKVFYVNQQRRGRTQAVRNKILAGQPAALLLGASPTMSTKDLTEMLQYYFKIDPINTPKDNIQWCVNREGAFALRIYFRTILCKDEFLKITPFTTSGDTLFRFSPQSDEEALGFGPNLCPSAEARLLAESENKTFEFEFAPTEKIKSSKLCLSNFLM
jgi:hypothetical protein